MPVENEDAVYLPIGLVKAAALGDDQLWDEHRETNIASEANLLQPFERALWDYRLKTEKSSFLTQNFSF